jgi:Uma2 family endonuclease
MAMPLTVHRFTVDEFQRMGDAGIFDEDDRVELIRGQVVEMSPIGVPHASCVKRLTSLFARLATAARATLSVQDPLVLGRHDEPQPDLALLRYRHDGYATGHPGPPDVLLVIEVADSTVARDRGEKLPLYAAAGIPEMWLVNLPGDHVEVHRQPSGESYADVRTARRGETVTPLAFPDLSLSVEEILGG